MTEQDKAKERTATGAIAMWLTGMVFGLMIIVCQLTMIISLLATILDRLP